MGPDNKIIFMWKINWSLTNQRLKRTKNSTFGLTIGLSQSFNFSRCKFQRYSTVYLLGYRTCKHPRNVWDAVDARKVARPQWRRHRGSGCVKVGNLCRESILYVWPFATPLNWASWENHINAKEKRDRICLIYFTPTASLLWNCFHFFKIKVYSPVLCLLLISFWMTAWWESMVCNGFQNDFW